MEVLVPVLLAFNGCVMMVAASEMRNGVMFFAGIAIADLSVAILMAFP